jgi:hypothetical protein
MADNDTTWVTSRTWSAGELVTASIMNAHVRDQLNALKTPAGGYAFVNEGTDYSTSSTSFADIDATDLALTFVTGGGDVLLGFTAAIASSGASAKNYFDIYESVANTRIGGDDGLTIITTANVTATNGTLVSFTVRIPSLSAASHTFKVQWKVSGGTVTMFAGAATANLDIHPNFWALEL